MRLLLRGCIVVIGMMSLYRGYGQVWSANLNAQLDEIAQQQINNIQKTHYRNNPLPTYIRKGADAYAVLVWAKSLQTATTHFNQSFSCNMSTKQFLDILTTYRQMTRFVEKKVGGGIEIDVKGFVGACQVLNTCYRSIPPYSDEGYKLCKSVATMYYNHAFILHSMLTMMKYGMLGEGNFVDAETNNAPYDLLLDQQTDGQSLDSSLHPVTNSDIYPTAGDVSKNASYAEVDPDFKRSDTSGSSSVSPSYTKSDNDTQLLGFDSSDPSITPSTHITLGKNILVGFDNSQTTDVSSYSSPTSTDPVVQSSIDQIVSHTSQIPQNSDTALSPISSALFCETGVQEPDTTDVELLSGLVHLANIRQNIINASVETQHALEKKGLGGVVNQILQDDYPDKHINDTTLYDAVYGGQIGIEDAAPHKQAYGQDIDRRPSFDYESKQEAIAQAAQSELAKRISDLLGGGGSYEQEAASCKKQFAEKFEICKGKINFKTIQVCIETELLILQKCVKNAMCTNLFSVWDYLGATICRVSKGRDKATTKSEVSSVQEIVQSIQGPLIFLKNSGKILPHKMKREFLDVTLNLKLSDLLSFQIWHNSKLVAPFGDHNRKTKLQEQKNKDRFESITKAVSQERLADKDKYSQAYNDIQGLSQTPLLTSQGVTYSQQIGDDIAFRYYGISHNQLITNTKLKHRTDILDLYDNHRKRTQAMRDTIALDTKKQADIAQTAARADQEGM